MSQMHSHKDSLGGGAGTPRLVPATRAVPESAQRLVGASPKMFLKLGNKARIILSFVGGVSVAVGSVGSSLLSLRYDIQYSVLLFQVVLSVLYALRLMAVYSDRRWMMLSAPQRRAKCDVPSLLVVVSSLVFIPLHDGEFWVLRLIIGPIAGWVVVSILAVSFPKWLIHANRTNFNLAVLGDIELIGKSLSEIRSLTRTLGCRVVEVYVDKWDGISQPYADSGLSISGTIASLKYSSALENADFVVMRFGDKDRTLFQQTLWDLDKSKSIVFPDISMINKSLGLPLAFPQNIVSYMPRRTSYPLLLSKRIFDWVASFVLLILFAIPMLIIVLAIKLNSKGPALFKQERIGFNGRPFYMFKFRTMVIEIDSLSSSNNLGSASDGAGMLFKMRRDPRVTTVGRFLRQWSIDELPQLFNVLAGAMSIVGPRPWLAVEHRLLPPSAKIRAEVKPGITGLWQVSGRSDLSLEDSIRLDLYYVDNWSLLGDLLIIFRTIGAIFRNTGAY